MVRAKYIEDMSSSGISMPKKEGSIQVAFKDAASMQNVSNKDSL
jgi:hypothetical protein